MNPFGIRARYYPAAQTVNLAYNTPKVFRELKNAAKYGYKQVQSFTKKSMPAIRFKTGGTGSKRKHIGPVMANGKFVHNKKKAKTRSTRSRASRVSNNSARTALAKGKSARAAGVRKKTLKISPKFRKRVKAVMADAATVGTHHVEHFGVLGNIKSGEQNTDRFAYNGVSTTAVPRAIANIGGADGFFDFFTHMELRHRASELWNSATVTPNYSDLTNLFDSKGLVLDVIYASAKIIFRNNSQYTKEVKFYMCVPKDDTDVTAMDCYINCLAKDNTQGLNMANCDTKVYGVTPSLCSSRFTKQWKYSVKTMILEPGQTSHFRIQGPKNAKYKYENFHDGVAEYTYPKNVGMSCFYTQGILDTASTNGATFIGAETNAQAVGKFHDQRNFPSRGIMVQVIRDWKLVAPDQTAEAQLLQGKYIHLNAQLLTASSTTAPGAPSATIIKYDPINPVSSEEPPQ